jgi:uncharacterized Zn-finger protein
MTPFETIAVEGRTVACNGGGGALGHPLVYLNLMPTGKVECPYCSRLYINSAIAAAIAAGEASEPGEGASGVPSPADKEAPPHPGAAAGTAPPVEANDD